MILYRLLADVVVIVHFAYVSFVLFGLLAILAGWVLRWSWVRNFWFRLAHLVAIAIVAGQSIAGMVCPLTTLENYLRRGAGQSTYPGAFIGYWAHRLMFFRAPSWVFTVAYVSFAIAVIATFLLIPPRWPRRRAGFPDGNDAHGNAK